MRRIWIALGAIGFVISLTISPALGQQATRPPVPRPETKKDPAKKPDRAPKKAPAKKPVLVPGKSAESKPAAPAEETPVVELKPITGEKVEIRLREGDILRGVLKGARAEVMLNGRYRKVENRTIEGAGIRIYYAMGLNGFVFVPYASISDIEFKGELTSEEGIDIARRIVAERKRSERQRIRLAMELEAKRRAKQEAAARKKAAEESGEETAEGTKPGTKKAGADAPKEGADRAKKIRALLKRYPPGKDWKPSRLAEIKDRQLILNIYPTEEERGFMENYDLWLEGYEIWRKLQDSAEE